MERRRQNLHEEGVKYYSADKRIRKLVRLAKTWGGSLKFMDTDTVLKCVDRDNRRSAKRPGKECYYSHPEGDTPSYVLTTHWRQKVIYLSPGCCPDPEPVLGYLIHEMGHVFADPRQPDEADEIAWLGWEIALARWVGCYDSWHKFKENFSFGPKKNLPNNLAALWEKYDDRVCHGACKSCCYPSNHLKRKSPLDEWAEWGDLNEQGQRHLTKDRVRHAISIGLVEPATRRPLPIDRPVIRAAMPQRKRPENT